MGETLVGDTNYKSSNKVKGNIKIPYPAIFKTI